MPRKKTSETLPEQIARLRLEAVKRVLFEVFADWASIKPLPDALKTGKNALVYDMAEMILWLVKARKPADLEILRRTVFPFIVPEIDELYMAIKKVGLLKRGITNHYREEDWDEDMEEDWDEESPHVDPATRKRWKESVLHRFDDSKRGFKAIIREDLEEDNLYFLIPSKAKRRFTIKLLQKVLKRNDLGSYGMDLIDEPLKKSKPT